MKPTTANDAVELIDEETVTDLAAFAERVITEATRLLDPDLSGWRLAAEEGKTRVYARPVRGTKLLITRSEDEVSAPAARVFDLLVSVKGFEIIDPATKNHHDPPVEVRSWASGRAEVARAKVPPMPLMSPREFVVLNLIDPTRQGPNGARGLFVSKSILHPKVPKTSGVVRALNTFAARTEPLGEGRCRVVFLNYADMGGNFPSAVMNRVGTRSFLQGVYKRLHEQIAAL